jgi:hypothetical protein
MVTMIALVLLTRYTLKLLSVNTRKPAYNLLPQYDVDASEIKLIQVTIKSWHKNNKY